MPEVCCRYCGRKLSSINVKTCSNPKCKKKLYKGDIVRCPDDIVKKCPFCNGSGFDPVPPRLCRVCGGKGKNTFHVPIKECDRCRERKGFEPYSFTHPCRKCKGKGWIEC